MADIVAAVTGVKAEDVSHPITYPVDTLLLGSAVYYSGIDNRMKEFIRTLDSTKVKNVICFSSAALQPSSYPQVRQLLEERGIKVDNREFHCRGALTLLHRGHPNDEDLMNLKAFVENLHL